MTKSEKTTSLVALSQSMVTAVEIVGESTVLVASRRRLHASSTSYANNQVLTADHVLQREDDIRIMLADGSEYPASIAGRDPGSDLALLQIESNATTPAHIPKQGAKVGQLVLALGRPSPEGIQASLGVISAIGSPIHTGRGGLLEDYLRSDTMPYTGFPGGPLIDTNGAVLGINTSGLAHGASLTIPQPIAWMIADTLAQHGAVRRGYLGIRSQPVRLPASQQQSLGRKQPAGLLVISVEANSPAEEEGLLIGDILVAINGK